MTTETEAPAEELDQIDDPTSEDFTQDTPAEVELKDKYDIDSMDPDAPAEEDSKIKDEVDPAKEPETPVELDPIEIQAKDFGMTDDEIKSLQDSGKLENVVTILDKKMAELGRGDAIPPADEPANVPGPEKQDQDTQPVADSFKVSLNPDDYDPEIIKTLNDMNDHFAKQFEGIRQQYQADIGQIQGVFHQQNLKSLQAEFDNLVGGLDPVYSELVGNGNLDKLEQNSVGFKNRIAILDEMDALSKGYQASGRNVPTGKTLFDKALKLVFSDKQAEIVRKELSGKIKRGGKRLMHRVSSGGKQKVSHDNNDDPTARATRAVAAKLKEKGELYDDDSYDGFL